jgi:ABC-type branched-subunit amino acid transport system substrate-binding protein
MNAVLSYPFIIGTIEAAEIVKQLRAANRDLVFFLCPADDALLLIKEAERVGWFPSLFLAGGAGSGIFDLPVEFNEKIFLAFATAPQDQSDEGVAEFRELNQKYKLSGEHKAAQVTALASAKVLAEGLKRAGKDLTREKLIQSLESLSNFATGLTQPVTYGPTRRLGVQGAYIIKVDLKEKNFVPVGWFSIN